MVILKPWKPQGDLVNLFFSFQVKLQVIFSPLFPKRLPQDHASELQRRAEEFAKASADAAGLAGDMAPLEKGWKKWMLMGFYPLVICYIAIENDHRNSGFSHIFPLKVVISYSYV